MDVVEAIDAWIDEEIDDLTDEELETILDVLDVVAASRFADLDSTNIFDDDIDELVLLVGGDADTQAYTEQLLLDALYVDAKKSADEDQDSADQEDDGDALLLGADTDELDDDTDELGDDELDDENINSSDDADLDDDDTTDAFDDDADELGEDELDADELGDENINSSDDADLDDDDTADASDDDADELGEDELDADELGDENIDSSDDADLDDHDTTDAFDDDADELGDENIDSSDDDAHLDDDTTDAFDDEDHEPSEDESDASAEPVDDEDHEPSEDESDAGAEPVGETDADDFDEDTETTDAVFLNDLAEAQHEHPLTDFDAEMATVQLEETVAPVPLQPFDDLGPTFLPESSAAPAPPKSRAARKILVPVMMIAGLAAFAYGMLQLLDSLDATEQAVATDDATPDAEPTETPTARPEPTEIPATAAPVDPSAPTPTPTPEPTPPPRVAIRLVTGDVMLASWTEVGGPAELTQLYDASDDDLSPAREIAWLSAGLGVINTDGDVLVVDPDARRPQPELIYEVGDDFEEAVEITGAGDLLVVRTEDGDITLSPGDELADEDNITVAWDAEEEDSAVVDISSVKDVVAFVLDDGDAQLIATSAENTVFAIWLAGDQPAAFNVNASETGILLGVGQGAVAKYQLGDFEGDQLQSVWDPFSTDEEPAIGYSSAGDRTAIVLGDGAIVLADDTGTGARVWDPADTEIRAFSVSGGDTQVVVLLETGSVVRIPFDPDELIESVWDITDETLSAAVEVAVESAED